MSTWDNATSPTGERLNGITFGNDTFVIVGDSGNIVRSTDNGSSWDNATSPTANYLYGVTFGNNTFVAVGNSGNIVRSTENGSSWDLGRVGVERGAYATLFFPLVALAISTVAENYQWSAYAGIGIVLILVGNLLMLKK